VGPNPGEFETISKALDASAKEGGATIEIKSGTYKERILMNKNNVRLVGLSDDVFVEWRTSTPYESVLEVTSENASVENVKFTHASKSVANNFGVFVKEGGSLKLRNVSVTSETGSGVATEGGSVDAENVMIDKCKNHGVSAFGNQSEVPKSGQVHLKNVAISNCGGDGILLRGGVQIDSLDVKIDNCSGFGVDAFENVQGTMKACKISKCKKGNVGGDNDNYDGNGVSIELV
jgi:pectin methylesterase-like acyl-CoA thioesterase